ncbi:hypothetical protein A3Q56_02130 [Intoshia linei]|uniref:Protein kinase domain-containing protein n=1 Tax=Intoshia linei TaxID=1819745 RepID=A0A177B743_9BILA|nr:hypothetical protein A3Q56_02130 [Intoshia linei]
MASYRVVELWREYCNESLSIIKSDEINLADNTKILQKILKHNQINAYVFNNYHDVPEYVINLSKDHIQYHKKIFAKYILYLYIVAANTNKFINTIRFFNMKNTDIFYRYSFDQNKKCSYIVIFNSLDLNNYIYSYFNKLGYTSLCLIKVSSLKEEIKMTLSLSLMNVGYATISSKYQLYENTHQRFINVFKSIPINLFQKPDIDSNHYDKFNIYHISKNIYIDVFEPIVYKSHFKNINEISKIDTNIVKLVYTASSPTIRRKYELLVGIFVGRQKTVLMKIVIRILNSIFAKHKYIINVIPLVKSCSKSDKSIRQIMSQRFDVIIGCPCDDVWGDIMDILKLRDIRFIQTIDKTFQSTEKTIIFYNKYQVMINFILKKMNKLENLRLLMITNKKSQTKTWIKKFLKSFKENKKNWKNSTLTNIKIDNVNLYNYIKDHSVLIVVIQQKALIYFLNHYIQWIVLSKLDVKTMYHTILWINLYETNSIENLCNKKCSKEVKNVLENVYVLSFYNSTIVYNSNQLKNLNYFIHPYIPLNSKGKLSNDSRFYQIYIYNIVNIVYKILPNLTTSFQHKSVNIIKEEYLNNFLLNNVKIQNNNLITTVYIYRIIKNEWKLINYFQENETVKSRIVWRIYNPYLWYHTIEYPKILLPYGKLLNKSCSIQWLSDLLNIECKSSFYIFISSLFLFITGLIIIITSIVLLKQFDRVKDMDTLYNLFKKNKSTEIYNLKRENITIAYTIEENDNFDIFNGTYLTNGVHIKTIVKVLKSRSNYIAKMTFYNEFLIMSSIKHENLIIFIGLIYKTFPITMIYENLNNKSLHKFLTDRKKLLTPTNIHFFGFSNSSLTTLAEGVIKGLIYLKEKEIIHGFICAKNVFVDSQYKTKIGNLMYASSFGEHNILQLFKENEYDKRWLSPEINLNNEIGYNTDVWGLGILIFEIITFCNIPFENCSLARLDERSTYLDGIRFENTTENCSINIIKKCLQFKINLRITINEAMEALKSKSNYLTMNKNAKILIGYA